ncbi:hypothetical protein KRR40_01535 [Niabella defluvii]|nr:hypothetical protein KRR40_01535 [Niabella sp. I65]
MLPTKLLKRIFVFKRYFRGCCILFGIRTGRQRYFTCPCIDHRQYRDAVKTILLQFDQLYRGGFNKSGIHNTLEAAVYGKPVLFGPNYQKFAEAIGLIKIKLPAAILLVMS